ncbi:hypothetical protein JTB14_018536 [Gonioctena quinquepunctata]|nr:hypothetical protein JTB14_018536 [Gonioctena quinquepunctata]
MECLPTGTKTAGKTSASKEVSNASYTIRRRFANELLDVALIQEPTGPEQKNGLSNIPDENMFHGLENEPRARKNSNGSLLTDFCSENVVTAQLTVPTDKGQLELPSAQLSLPGTSEQKILLLWWST